MNRRACVTRARQTLAASPVAHYLIKANNFTLSFDIILCVCVGFDRNSYLFQVSIKNHEFDPFIPFLLLVPIGDNRCANRETNESELCVLSAKNSTSVPLREHHDRFQCAICYAHFIHMLTKRLLISLVSANCFHSKKLTLRCTFTKTDAFANDTAFQMKSITNSKGKFTSGNSTFRRNVNISFLRIYLKSDDRVLWAYSILYRSAKVQ